MEIAKDMKKDVLITIKGTQRVGGESDVIEMMTTGRFYRKNKLYYISYEETEATGYEGCRTTLKVGPNDKVTMTRFGPSRSQLIVEQGVRHQCQYDTGYGAMTIGVMGDSFESTLSDRGGAAAVWLHTGHRGNSSQREHREHHRQGNFSKLIQRCQNSIQPFSIDKNQERKEQE